MIYKLKMTGKRDIYMKINKIIGAALLVVVAGVTFSLFSTAQQSEPFTSTEKDQINSMIREYILTNPEIIPQAVEVLRSRQNANVLSKSEDLLYNDGFSFVAGNMDADVTIVEFYDYNCGYCKQVPAAFARLLDEDANVKIIYKELPILAPSSEYASMAAMASMKQGKFMEFHTALMKNKKELDEDLVMQIALSSGLDKDVLIKDMENPDIQTNIMQTKYLVQNIGLSGTPGFVIGDQLIPGYIPYEKLKEIVDQVRETRKM
jgi:protein-disulfide isomerase